MGFESGRLVRAVMKVTRASEQHVNTLHYDLTDVALEPENNPQLLADALRDALMPKYAALYDNTWTVQPVEVVEERDPLHPNDARQGWLSGSATPGVRSTASERLPSACCAVATLKTANVGRRARGRMFLSGTLTELDQNGGVWQGSILALWQALLNAIPLQPDIYTGTSLSHADWAVYSRTQRAADLDPYAPHVTGAVLRTGVHWLRSRET